MNTDKPQPYNCLADDEWMRLNSELREAKTRYNATTDVIDIRWHAVEESLLKRIADLNRRLKRREAEQTELANVAIAAWERAQTQKETVTPPYDPDKDPIVIDLCKELLDTYILRDDSAEYSLSQPTGTFIREVYKRSHHDKIKALRQKLEIHIATRTITASQIGD